MNNILDDLYIILEKNITPDISTERIMMFILGEENEGEIAPSDFYKIKKNKMQLSEKQRTNLARSKDWSFKRLERIVEEKYYHTQNDCYKKKNVRASFDFENISAQLKKMHEKYIDKNSIYELSECEMMKMLISLHFLRTIQSQTALNTEIIKKSNYVPWKEKEEELRNQIELNQITVVCGNAACGKKKLVWNYLRKNGSLEYLDIECRPGEKLREKKIEIKYLGQQNVVVKINELPVAFEKKDKNTKLIIKCTYLKEDDINFLDQLKSKTQIKIIIVTRTMKIPSIWGKVYISECPEKMLKKILGKYCNIEQYSNDVMSRFFSILHYNPYLTELIAKYLKKSNEYDISQFIKKLHDEGETCIVEMSKGKKINSSYRDEWKTRAPYPLSTLIGRILKPLDDDSIKQVVRLSIWTRTPITEEFLITVGSFTGEEVKKAINNGILEYRNPNVVQMPEPLIWAIWTQNIVIDIDGCDNNLPVLQIVFDGRRVSVDEDGISTGEMLLDKIIQPEECSVDVIEFYYSTLKNIIYRYHKVYSRVAYENKLVWERYYVRWTEFLENTILRLKSIGNIKFAEWINEKIYTKYKKREFFFQANDEQKGKKQLNSFETNYMMGIATPKQFEEMVELYKKNGELNIEQCHFLLDFGIQKEIDRIIGKMTKNPEKVYLKSDEYSVIPIIEKYLNCLWQNNIQDEYQIIYHVCYIHLKAIYHDPICRSKMSEVKMQLFDNEKLRYVQDKEVINRSRLYCFLVTVQDPVKI